MAGTEEVEIKIEYNESFETDPLCDKMGGYLETGNNGASDDYQRCKLDVAVPDETCDVANESCDGILYSHKNIIDNMTKSALSWYKSIDNLGRYICQFCNLKYSTLQTLKFHVKNKHPEQVAHIKENIVKCNRASKLKCHICKMRFKEIPALKTHVNNYHLLSNIKTSCVHCDATFGSENEMFTHLFAQHKKVIYKSGYVCNICGYRTSTRSHYTQHRNIHVGAKTNKCQHCDYTTHYLPNLKIHERIHTEDKVYVCDFVNCAYRCSAKSALRSHQLKHYPEKNALYCDKCSYKTIYRQSLKRHNECHNRNNVKLKVL